MNIEYTKVGDYLLPNLVIDNKNYEQIKCEARCLKNRKWALKEKCYE